MVMNILLFIRLGSYCLIMDIYQLWCIDMDIWIDWY